MSRLSSVTIPCGASIEPTFPTMLTDQDAFAALAAADGPEKTRSAYWEYEVGKFTVTAAGAIVGRTTLGNASRKLSPLRNAVHYLLQRPLCRFAAGFRDFADCERLGRQVAAGQGRQFNCDMLRQVLALALIRHHINFAASDDCNLVIGDGYGVMTAMLMLHAPHRRTITINLTKPLLLDLTHVRQALPEARLALVADADDMRAALADERISLIGIRADDLAVLHEAPIGLAVNIVSMQEMDPPVVARYFDVLRRNRARQTAFYCCNKLFKESNFADYPWQSEDKILHDSECPWAQWYYSPWPPFWHRRAGGERKIWHRLAWLKKESA